MITNYHAKYFEYYVTPRVARGLDWLSISLFDSAIDLNPHQIDMALFALQSPLSKGVVSADEVGLGKTIEAGIVLCHCWAERKRIMLMIFPASILKEWALEFGEKFKEIEQRLSDLAGHLHSFLVSGTPSHVMRLLWLVAKDQMQECFIVFQEDKITYVRSILEGTEK